jgi:hypothetical protein
VTFELLAKKHAAEVAVMEMFRAEFPPGRFCLSEESRHWDWEKVTTGRSLGVGLAKFGDQRLHSAVLVSLQAEQKQIFPGLSGDAPYREDDEIGRALRSVRSTIVDTFGKGAEQKISVIGIPSPRPLYRPGFQARCGAMPGTFGARVITANGRDGILTAGHVAPNPGAPAYEGSNLIGTVSSSMYRATATPSQPAADIALVELLQQGTSVPQDRVFPEGVGDDGDLVTSYGAVTTGEASKIEIVLPAFGDPQEDTGVLGDVMLTTQAISTFGDSGAMVVLRAQGRLVGHIVAGFPATSDFEGYSVVQDLRYQLNWVSARLAG